ncbi:MAG: CHAP domain-containing protein [Streptococcaceae bacterium]|nr:CHAP domain-containing protein [Streptococcaceae bacterium]
MKKKIVSGLMLSAIVFASVGVSTKASATTTADLDKIIANAQAGSATAKTQADSLAKQVEDSKTKLATLTAQQADTTKQINTLSAQIKDRQISLAAQARSAQTDGGAANYINVVLSSKSLTDAVQKVTAMSEVVGANNTMLQQQEADKKTLDTKMAANKTAYAEATKIQQNLASQEQEAKVAQLSYQATITTATNQKAAIQAQIVAAQKAEAARVAAQEKAQAAAAANIAKAQAQAAAQSPAASTSTTTSSQSTGSSYTSVATPTTSSGSNPYPAGQCTAFVYDYFGGIPNYSGNAGDWVAYANSGLAVNTIVVFPPGVDGAGGVGHVAAVTKVNSDGSFEIIEGNYAGGWGTTRHIASAAGLSFIRP